MPTFQNEVSNRMFRRLWVPTMGPIPTYDHDYRSGVLGPGTTFTRASSGTFFDSAGTLQTAGNDVPRFNFDPVTLQCRGLLMEPTRTNLLLNSASLSTQNVTVTAVAHTLSFYGTGSITLTGAASATLNGTGAFPTRVTLTFTPSAGTLTLTVSGTVSNAQLEVGTFASSWIPTTGASATRQGDGAIITDLNAIGYNQSEGTFFVQSFNGDNLPAAGAGRILFSAYQNSDATNFRTYFEKSAANTILVQSVLSGANQFTGFSNASVPTGSYKLALAYKTNDSAVSHTGSIATDTSCTPPTTIDRIGIGNQSANFQFGSEIARFSYYNYRLPDAALQGLTA